jgi:RNA polymerase sigma-70 factor (ECF subfamily)
MARNNINIKLIIEGCRRGNRKSQQVLFEHYFGFAMNICLRYAKNREEAEEILNNGFLKVFRFIDKYESAYPFTSWLHRIIVNASIDYHRANRKYPKILELSAANQVADEPMPLPELSENEDVLPILQQLSPVYRMVFNLYVMEGYRHDEIAELLDISAASSRSNLFRAKRNLKILLEQQREKKVTVEVK